MNITPISPVGSGNTGIVPPWLQHPDSGFHILPFPFPQDVPHILPMPVPQAASGAKLLA